MKHIASLLLLTVAAACNSATTSNLESAPVAPQPLIEFDSWHVAGNIGLGSEGVTASWLEIDEAANALTVQIRWDLIPYFFTTTIVDDSVDSCGNRHLVSAIDGGEF